MTHYLVDANVISAIAPTASVQRSELIAWADSRHASGFADVAIAATARRHDLTILTRNARHFAPLDVSGIDPFRELPQSRRR